MQQNLESPEIDEKQVARASSNVGMDEWPARGLWKCVVVIWSMARSS